jgi:hypothetical protein
MAWKRGWPSISVIALAAAALYFSVRIAQAPPAIEAPGFLVSIDPSEVIVAENPPLAPASPSDEELHIAAYIPVAHLEYTERGMRATVIFPDGSRRVAETADMDDLGPQLPNRELYGDETLGVLVRMDFVDGEARAGSEQRLRDGLPVKLRFAQR